MKAKAKKGVLFKAGQNTIIATLRYRLQLCNLYMCILLFQLLLSAIPKLTL